jgi:biopolymer transport protein ExbD
MGRQNRLAARRGAAEEDFELNLASIIDCFTVVITYLLFSASFISLAEMDVSAVTVGSDSKASAPAITIEVGMDQGKTLRVQVRGAENISVAFPPKDGGWDLESLEKKLGEIKMKYPEVDSLALGAGDDIKYQEVVKALESSRKIYPKVGLTSLTIES